MVSVAVIVGSLRRGSINRKLAAALTRLAEGKLDLQLVEIADVPLFNQDLEREPPAGVVRFKAAVAAADAVLFVTPEYNRSISGVMKNVIDWGTRPSGQNVWGGKPAAIIGASRGRLGTAAAQQHLRNVLATVNMAVMAQPEAFVTLGAEQMDEAGNLLDASLTGRLEKFLDRFAAWTARAGGR